ncbi:helix-turn-helix transcriptional regulator [Saccharicrinis sp. 156]|uniref:helix-turn-helix transcriptional regulator n=1 Tax=Saccharicrinis sp. 156 TaxID=3417574 RepID=UPI003D33F61E
MSKQKLNRIKPVLAEYDKSAKWLAEQLCKDKSTVSRWCTNDMQPSVETFHQIAELLNIDIRELFVPTRIKENNEI